jgi:TM2 domain-containing membrane protein YozV
MPTEGTADLTKACPFCGEKVLAAAKKCKHCGEVIDVAFRAVEEVRRATAAPAHGPMVFMNAGGGGGGASSAAASSGGATAAGLPEAGKSRTVVAILAILFGGIGIHKFYLGKGFQGVLYLLFCWAFIPCILGLIEGISYLGMSDRKFAEKYG